MKPRQKHGMECNVTQCLFLCLLVSLCKVRPKSKPKCKSSLSERSAFVFWARQRRSLAPAQCLLDKVGCPADLMHDDGGDDDDDDDDDYDYDYDYDSNSGAAIALETQRRRRRRCCCCR